MSAPALWPRQRVVEYFSANINATELPPGVEPMKESVSISARICDALALHEARTGAKPTRIYLGIEEDGELSALTADAARFPATPPVEMGFVRRKFHGAEIYRVDAATHLQVS